MKLYLHCWDGLLFSDWSWFLVLDLWNDVWRAKAHIRFSLLGCNPVWKLQTASRYQKSSKPLYFCCILERKYKKQSMGYLLTQLLINDHLRNVMGAVRSLEALGLGIRGWELGATAKTRRSAQHFFSSCFWWIICVEINNYTEAGDANPNAEWMLRMMLS